jgi:hypothetical protein
MSEVTVLEEVALYLKEMVETNKNNGGGEVSNAYEAIGFALMQLRDGVVGNPKPSNLVTFAILNLDLLITDLVGIKGQLVELQGNN